MDDDEYTWCTLKEFARIYGRTRAWAYFNAASGNFMDFGITTLQVARTPSGLRNSRSWYFCVPNVVLADQTSNSPVDQPLPKS